MDLDKLKKMFYQLMIEQQNLRVNARKQACEFSLLHAELEEKINLIDRQIREAYFIDYCNTSCWRYQC